MFVEYPNFIMPRHDTKIWRYMDFTKFVSLLDTEAIFLLGQINLLMYLKGRIQRQTMI